MNINLEKHYRERNVLVTGATSGNGEALAYRLLDLGAEVLCLGRNEERLQDLSCCGAHTCQLDFADQGKVEEFCDSYFPFWEFDDIFHMAGNGFFGTLTPDWKSRFEQSDFRGPTQLLKGLLPRMKAGGTVAVISSAIAGLGDIPELRDYQGMKRKMVDWCRTNTNLYASQGLNLMLISMGFIGTDIWNRASGLPRWAGNLVQKALPDPGEYTSQILEDAANWESVSYPGWLAKAVKVDVPPAPFVKDILTGVGRIGIRTVRSFGGYK
ncbi:MAG: SDR family oxidoreductase [Bacteroidota bacterium]